MINNLAAATSVRPLTVNDVPQALQLSSQAGWNQTARDWQTVLELAPDTCFALNCGGELAATATLVCYSQSLAWLGMVLTRPDFQRRGFARLLVQRALKVADDKGIQTVKLDATNQGQGLYESLGFVAERDVERWSGSGPTSKREIIYGSVAGRLDWSAMPAERYSLLQLLAWRAPPLVEGNDFAMYRDGLRATYLGPCLARSEESAARLIGLALAQVSGPWLWDLFPGNSSAVALAAGLGFRRERKLTRMSRGVPFHEDGLMVYAITGFEFG